MEIKDKNVKISLELLKINQDTYKSHFDWVVKIFIIYFMIIGALYSFITQTNNNVLISMLYILIISSSIIIIYASILIKICVNKYLDGLRKIIINLDYNIDYLTYPAKKGSTLLIISCSIIIIITSILLVIQLLK